MSSLLVLGAALCWALIANLVGGALRTAAPSGAFPVIWTLTVIGSFHAVTAGVLLARAADQSAPVSRALATALNPRALATSLRVGYVQLLTVIGLGFVARHNLGFDLPFDAMPSIQDAFVSVREIGTSQHTVVILRAVLSTLLGVAEALLPAIAGLYLAFSSCAGITVIPSAVDGTVSECLHGTIRSIKASWINAHRAGLVGWILVPGFGICLLLANATGPDALVSGSAALASSALLFWILPPLTYVASREMVRGIFANLPKGFRPTHGVLIEGDQLDDVPQRPR